METLLLFIFCLALMVVGFAGTIFAFLPNVPLSWLGLFIFALATDFKKISLFAVLVFLGFTAAVMIFDFIFPILGAKTYKASKYGILGATLGSVFGIFIFGILGFVIGPLIGVILGELLAKKDSKQITKSAFGILIGLLTGTLLKMILILAMASFFIFSVLTS